MAMLPRYNDENLSSPIIFIGPGRSGSTVVSEVVMAHEALAWPSNYLEYFPAWPSVNLCRSIFDNVWWTVLGEKGQINRTRFMNSFLPYPAEAFSFWDRISRPEINFSRKFLLGELATGEERQRIRHAISRVVVYQAKHRFSMKITGPGRIGYLQSIFPDALFVNVIRDPVATVDSLLNVPFWQKQGARQLWWTGAYRSSELIEYAHLRGDAVASTAYQLAKVLSTTEDEAKACNANMLTVRYEDFVSNTADLIRQVCEFLNLPPSVRIDNKIQATKVRDQNCQKKMSEDDEFKIVSIMQNVAGWHHE